jgi:hypothetical protein
MRGMLRNLSLLFAAAPLFAADDWVELFNGKDLAGWRAPMGTWSAVGGVVLDPAKASVFVAQPGAGVLLNSAGSKTVDAVTEREHGDCRLEVEFCVPKGSNSGVYFMGRYEVQVFDSHGKAEVKSSDVGGIYEREAKDGFHGSAPKVNASKPPGEWQRFEIVFQAPRFDAAGNKTANAKFLAVKLNGQLVQENVEVDGPTRAARFRDEKPAGPLQLQGDHGPVAFRNLRLKEGVQP